jgi:putative oxidoreductase
MGEQQMETLNRFQPYVLSLLRIVVGLLFLQHGLSKLFGFPTGAGFPAFLSLSWFEGCIEMIGGGLIVIGLFTRLAAFITSGEMAIGYFMVHAPNSFFPYVNGGTSRSFIASYSFTLCSLAQARLAWTRSFRKRREARCDLRHRTNWLRSNIHVLRKGELRWHGKALLLL